ncbi:armadillo repeat-containing X-linked protein 1 isoform X5 [Pan troglodytes]|uniref:armadillo repeat-containing X-linked protein 1 isoform X5 n=1 Tax=Pan troglodytes TaxID=9598 RepID=UPI00301405A1
MGVVIGVLISWLTWPSRELEPRRADVLLILVFVWSGCTLPIAQRARGPVAWGKEDEVLPGSQQDAVPFGNKGIVCLESLQILGPEASPTLGAGRNAKLSRTKVLGVGPSTKHSLLKFVSLEGLVEAETEVREVCTKQCTWKQEREGKKTAWTSVGACRAASEPASSSCRLRPRRVRASLGQSEPVLCSG